MDVDDFRLILERSGVDVWSLIDTAIHVAALDFRSELKQRRDEIVGKLYSAPNSCNRCGSSDFGITSNGEHETKGFVEKESKGIEGGGGERVGSASPSTPLSVDDEDEFDPFAGIFEDEPKKILEIKEQLEDPDQPEEGVVDLLQTLADMDITFQALKETDIGRHVNRLRKHSSSDVRRLVKQLVRKWKEIVDEWVRVNPQGEHASPTLIADGDSPPRYHQVPDFAYSPNPHNGSSGSDKNTPEPEQKPKPVPRKEPPPKPMQRSAPALVSAPHNVQKQVEPQRESNFDSERLASASKRLQANYKEAENAKKQRTIRVMDIHELPKPKNKNTFFGKNRGSGSQGRHW